MKFLEIMAEDGTHLTAVDNIIDISPDGTIIAGKGSMQTLHTYAEIRNVIWELPGSSKAIHRVAPKSKVWGSDDPKS